MNSGLATRLMLTLGHFTACTPHLTIFILKLAGCCLKGEGGDGSGQSEGEGGRRGEEVLINQRERKHNSVQLWSVLASLS